MSHYKPYPAYKDSGVEWLGEVPEHWGAGRLRYICQCLDGQRIPLNAAQRFDRLGDIPYWGANSIVDYVDESLFDEDLVLLGEDGAPFFEPSKPVAFFSQGKVWPNNHVHVLRPVIRGTGKFIAHVLNVTDYAHFIDGSTRDKLTQGSMKDIPIPQPPLPEQSAIAAFLDRETAKIDVLADKKIRLIELIREKIVALASQPPGSPDVAWIRLSHVCDVISRPVLQQGDHSYTKLGLFNRGRGIFRKDATDTEDMGDSEFFWIQSGDLILSGQFAWEGAVALASDEHTGCVVSHRFPVIRGRVDQTLTEYLFAYFLTHHGDFVLNDCSRGSAGRNRPLNMNALLSWHIPIPLMQIQQEIADLVYLHERIGALIMKSVFLLKEHRSGIIAAAVTGKIDISGAT